jgi:hypothetical protein
MTERKGRKRRAPSTKKGARAARRRDSDEAERSLGRTIAVALPLAGAASALIVGFVTSFGSAILILAASALLGTIAFLWASLRTLSGDAPLPSKLDALAASRPASGPKGALAERKRRVLRSLKDLENEHALGKIDDGDYATFVTRYREEAKEIMREMDEETAPELAEAERIANEYLQARGLTGKEPPAVAVSADRSAENRDPDRLKCSVCGASNESDSAFCKACGGAMTQPSTPQKESDAPA